MHLYFRNDFKKRSRKMTRDQASQKLRLYMSTYAKMSLPLRVKTVNKKIS